MSLFHQISIETNLNPVFMTAMEMLDDENYLGADGRHLFVCQKNRYNDCIAIKLLLLHVQCMCEHSYITSIEWSMLYCVGQYIANKSAASVYILPTLHVWPRIELFYLMATCICMYTCMYNVYMCNIIIIYSEAAVESDLLYMLQPSRIYIGDNVNSFHHGTVQCIISPMHV